MVYTLYLAHNFLTRKQIRKWELYIEGKYNIQLDNPFYDNPDRVVQMKSIDKFPDDSKQQKEVLKDVYLNDHNIIVENDLTKIRKADGIIALAQNVRVGTLMEIFFASRILRIPTFVITRKYANHPWITTHATRIFSSRKQLEEYIRNTYGTKT